MQKKLPKKHKPASSSLSAGKTSFRDAVRAVVGKIPKSKVMTYAEVAKKAGYPGASRAVGSLMAKNFDPTIPCHRVIRSDGTIGNYNRGGSIKKLELLKKEGAL